VFLEEMAMGITIMLFFIVQATIAMIGNEAPSPTCIHNQSKKMKMGEHKLPHYCTMRNITMARNFAHVHVFLGNKHT